MIACVRRPASPVNDRSALVVALVLAAGFIIAAVVGYELIHPLSASPIGYDTAGSVLYFQRIVHGQLLERPYGATPKPAMTLIDGLLFTLGGWQAVSIAAVAACAVLVTLGAELVRRMAGPAAGAFAFVALLGSQPLLLDESLAYAVSWAGLWLLLAAFAVRAERPRYVVVGVALCMATLTRLESIVVVVGAIAAVATWSWIVPRLENRWPGRLGLGAAPRGAWFVALGLLAIPVMLVHDWVLTRNPMYWASVSAGYSAADPTAVRSPVALVLWLARHYVGMPLLVVLACLGGVMLVRRRQHGIAVGLALLGPGIVASLVLLAARGTYVSARYVYLADLAVTVAAAIGFATVRVPEIAAAFRSHARTGIVIALAGAAAVGMSAAVPFAPLDTATRRLVVIQRTVAQNIRAVEPLLRRALQVGGSTGTVPVVIAPGLWTPRLIVDLGLRIPDVGVPKFNAAGNAYASALQDGQLIYHDRVGDPANAVAAAMEAGGPVTVGGATLTLVASDPTAGWWLFRVAAGP